MATKTRMPLEHIGQVRFPGEFVYGLDDFLGTFHRQIVNQSAALAFARKIGPKAGVVTAADIVEAIKILMPSALAEFEKTLKPRETRHAHKKAS